MGKKKRNKRASLSKKRQSRRDDSWTPFIPLTSREVDQHPFKDIIDFDGYTPWVDSAWHNNHYLVVSRVEDHTDTGWGQMVHCFVFAKSGHTIGKQRDIYRIRREIMGTNVQAVEVLDKDAPEDGQTVRHFWILQPTAKVPFAIRPFETDGEDKENEAAQENQHKETNPQKEGKEDGPDGPAMTPGQRKAIQIAADLLTEGAVSGLDTAVDPERYLTAEEVEELATQHNDAVIEKAARNLQLSLDTAIVGLLMGDEVPGDQLELWRQECFHSDLVQGLSDEDKRISFLTMAMKWGKDRLVEKIDPNASIYLCKLEDGRSFQWTGIHPESGMQVIISPGKGADCVIQAFENKGLMGEIAILDHIKTKDAMDTVWTELLKRQIETMARTTAKTKAQATKEILDKATVQDESP